ncbi:hypothetical protein CSQ89_19680 [Chitinimonas sp. BJB300]|nr:hypothetical protein CSQ89_19680 [Chitinimonas sp. BJB300]
MGFHVDLVFCLGQGSEHGGIGDRAVLQQLDLIVYHQGVLSSNASSKAICRSSSVLSLFWLGGEEQDAKPILQANTTGR